MLLSKFSRLLYGICLNISVLVNSWFLVGLLQLHWCEYLQKKNVLIKKTTIFSVFNVP